MATDLNTALREEHKALHAWMVSGLLHEPPAVTYGKYCDLIDAHDEVAVAWGGEEIKTPLDNTQDG